MIHIRDTCRSDAELKKPEIIGEEDRPFAPNQVESGHCGMSTTQDIPTLMKLNEQKHSHEVDNFKNYVGGVLLAVCILIVVVLAILDAILKIDSALFTGAFEFAKTIATAVIGYFFATTTKEK